MSQVFYYGGSSEEITLTVEYQPEEWRTIYVFNEDIFPSVAAPGQPCTYTATVVDDRGQPISPDFVARLKINGDVVVDDIAFYRYYDANTRTLRVQFNAPGTPGIYHLQIEWTQQIIPGITPIGYYSGSSPGVSFAVSSQHKYIVVSNERISQMVLTPGSSAVYTATITDNEGNPLPAELEMELILDTTIKILDVDFSLHYNPDQKLLTCAFSVPTAVGIGAHRVKLRWAEQGMYAGGESSGVELYVAPPSKDVIVMNESITPSRLMPGQVAQYTALIADNENYALPPFFLARLVLDGVVLTNVSFNTAYDISTKRLTVDFVVPNIIGVRTVKLAWDRQLDYSAGESSGVTVEIVGAPPGTGPGTGPGPISVESIVQIITMLLPLMLLAMLFYMLFTAIRR